MKPIFIQVYRDIEHLNAFQTVKQMTILQPFPHSTSLCLDMTRRPAARGSRGWLQGAPSLDPDARVD